MKWFFLALAYQVMVSQTVACHVVACHEVVFSGTGLPGNGLAGICFSFLRQSVVFYTIAVAFYVNMQKLVKQCFAIGSLACLVSCFQKRFLYNK